MNLQTLYLAHEVLTERSVRAAARKTGRAPSTTSGALARLEMALSIPLVRRDRHSFVLTLEAERCMPMIASVASHIQSFLHEAGLTSREIPQISIGLLSHFVAVVHFDSIRRAARSLDIGQPQMSRQMTNAERLLGQTLFSRSPQGVRATAAAHRLALHARAIVTDWEMASQTAVDRFRRGIFTWRMGTVVSLGHESSIARMLARLVANWAPFQERRPLQISSHMADELMHGLTNRRFDLIMLDHGNVPNEFRSMIIYTAPLALFGKADIIRPARDISGLLRSRPLVLPSRRSGIRQETERYIERQLGPDWGLRLKSWKLIQFRSSSIWWRITVIFRSCRRGRWSDCPSRWSKSVSPPAICRNLQSSGDAVACRTRCLMRSIMPGSVNRRFCIRWKIVFARLTRDTRPAK